MNDAKHIERFIPHDSANWTSLQGYIRTSYAALVRAFGPPNGGSDGYKVSTEWVLRDTLTGESVTIYDWKSTDLYEPDLPSPEALRAQPWYVWHIGGLSTKSLTALVFTVRAAGGDPDAALTSGTFSRG